MRPVKPYTKIGSDCLPNRAQSKGIRTYYTNDVLKNKNIIKRKTTGTKENGLISFM